MERNLADILIVDDDKENGLFLEEQLTHKTSRAKWFGDPREALRQFQKDQYHVGILDLKMPHISGLELFHKLREKDPNIGLIILTGYPSIDSALATLRTGAYDYLKKPYQIQDLKLIVHRLLEEKGVFLETETVMNTRIGERIKEYRLKRRWTIAKLASQANLSKSLISQIENAKNSASLFSLAKLARSLKVRLADLVQDL